MILQLDPPVPLDTDKGPGMAALVIDYGPDFSLLWVVFLDADGACWTLPNDKVRAVKNVTMGRRNNLCLCSGADCLAETASLNVAELMGGVRCRKRA